jgi:sec-independent protein translocase protein TatA
MAMFGMPGGMEIWIILAVVLIIFGPTQLPKLAKMFGKSAKSLKDGLDGKLEDDEVKPLEVKAEAKTEAEPEVKKDAGEAE